MFHENDLRAGLALLPSPTSSPLLKPRTWWGDSPSRQSTTASTVASEFDFRLTPAASPRSAYEARNSPLHVVKEQRGWKHFCKNIIALPLALAVGFSVGMLIAVVGLFGVGHSAPPGSEALLPYATAPPPQAVPESYMAAQPLNNSCLTKSLVIPDGLQTFDACGFVIRSTDEIWNLRGDVDAAIEKYFHTGYIDAGSWGRRIIGKKALREAVLSQMRAFPDIKIHITDCVCKGNDNDGYKCGMPDVLTGTNTGPSSYGPPTGRFARWTGMVESLVKKDPATGQWQYYAEWGVHDEWSLIQQLGLDFSRVQVPDRAINTEPIHDCTPLFRFGPEPIINEDDLMDQEKHKLAVKKNF